MGAWECPIWTAIVSLKVWLSWVDPCWFSRVEEQGWGDFFQSCVKTLAWEPRKTKGWSTVFYRILQAPSWTSSVLWPFLASKGAVTGHRNGCCIMSARGTNWLIAWGDSLPIDSGARLKLLIWRLDRNTLPLHDWAIKAGLVDMPDRPCCGRGQKETAMYTFYNCDRVQPFWSAWLASILNSSCCSTLVMSWTMFYLLGRVKIVWGFSQP